MKSFKKSNFFAIVLFTSLASNFFSCYKPKTNVTQEENYYSLKITTNYKGATNYSVNVTDLERIKEGTEITISNTAGYYKIIQFLTTDNSLLSTDNSYTFKMDSDKEIKVIFKYDTNYYDETVIYNASIANIILMAGQSNTEGYDGLVNTLPFSTIKEYKKGHDNVRINYNCYGGGNYTYGIDACGKFVGVDFGQGKSNNEMGAEVGLSKYLGEKDPENNYFLVKAAWGGTNLQTYWNPANINSNGTKYMYGRFVRCVNAAIDNLKSKNITPKIRAMLWFQGESDAEDSTRATNYSSNFSSLTSDVRTRFAEYISEDFKWISAGISSTGWTYYEKVNEALRNQSDAFLEETITLPKINGAHYTAQSYLTIGELFGRYYLN